MEPMREVYWNIPESYKAVFYGATALAIVSLVLGTWARMSIWSKGKDEDDILRGASIPRFLWLSISTFFSPDCFLARKLFARSWYRGAMLVAIMWSFLILLVGTIIVTFEHYLGLDFFLRGRPYLLISLILDLAGVLVLVGIIVALVRRYTTPLNRRITTLEDLTFLLLLLGIVLLGFFVEGLRLAHFRPEGMDWSPMGYLFATLFTSFFPGEALEGLHRGVWLAHGLLAQVFIAYLPFSKIFHMLAAQISTTMASQRYGGIVYE